METAKRRRPARHGDGRGRRQLWMCVALDPHIRTGNCPTRLGRQATRPAGFGLRSRGATVKPSPTPTRISPRGGRSTAAQKRFPQAPFTPGCHASTRGPRKGK